MTPCTTLEQRWRSCRGRVYGEERVSDFAWCNLWAPFLTREELFGPRPNRGRHRWPVTSPRRHHCRTGTTRPGRNDDPANWACTGQEMFLGPIAWRPIDDAIWYERSGPRVVRMRVPITGGHWDWFNATWEP